MGTALPRIRAGGAAGFRRNDPRDLGSGWNSGQTPGVTLPKSETRELADRESSLRRTELEAWHMSTSTFFSAFVVIAAGLALAALILR